MASSIDKVVDDDDNSSDFTGFFWELKNDKVLA